MRVVVVGSGAREDALRYVLSRTANVVVSPGRPGIPGSVSTPPEDLEADLFVVGPEVFLVEGQADRLRAQGKLVLGPGADGAQLEGSKIWMKRRLNAAGVPTATWGAYSQVDAAIKDLERFFPPWVVKTDYLAAGKGVLVTSDLAEAQADIRAKLAGGEILIEQSLKGVEYSFFALCWGTGWTLFPLAQDYKRLLDGDQGPNTGGMGAYSPVPSAPSLEALAPHIDATLAELRKQGIDYRGFLFGGIMVTPGVEELKPHHVKFLEYNIRFGDPEAEVVLPRIQGDVAQIFAAAAAGKEVGEIQADGACVTVVLASEGYPQAPKTGDVITGLDEAAAIPGAIIFHAGTDLDANGNWVTAGGRVLAVTAKAPTVPEARQIAYQAVAKIHFRGMHYRTDIAEDGE